METALETQETVGEHENNIDIAFRTWINKRHCVITKLSQFADEFEKTAKNVRIAKLTGTFTSTFLKAGSVITGLIAIPTVGATAPLAIGLGIASVVGELTTAGSNIAKSVIDDDLLEATQAAIDSDNRQTANLQNCIKNLEPDEFNSGPSFLSPVNDNKYRFISATKMLLAGQVSEIATRIGGEIFAPFGRVLGPVLGLVILPMNIYNFVAFANDTDKPSAIADEIRQHAEHLQEELDRITEITNINVPAEMEIRREHDMMPNGMKIKSESDIIMKLVLGDLIEIKRKGGLYSHWAVYIGNGFVIHMYSTDGTYVSKKQKAIVRKDELKKVIEGCTAKKNNSKDKRLGSFVIPEEVVKRAKALEGECFYKLLHFNCEHFANLCRYGFGSSSQAEIFFTVMTCLFGEDVHIARKTELEETAQRLNDIINEKRGKQDCRSRSRCIIPNLPAGD